MMNMTEMVPYEMPTCHNDSIDDLMMIAVMVMTVTMTTVMMQTVMMMMLTLMSKPCWPVSSPQS